uniref:Protein kinase domain-containing protein n=1 Tax=Davidia involucrata TaxID=16924 RepID=A0A5B7CBE9_DAVIN
MASVGVLGLLYVFWIIPLMTSSISDSEALLELKKSLTNTKALNSWGPDSDPCTKGAKWAGLLCYNGIVIGLRLEQMGLSGAINVEPLVQIPGLRSISFMNNSFSGSIPEFNRMGALKAIYLSGNQFSGEIPASYFAKMESLKKVWLSQNNFTGEIPSSLSQLPNLIELHLENNQFSGAIPPLGQPTLKSFDVSNNALKGEIPDTLSKFNASSFEGNPGLCGAKLGKACDQSNRYMGNDSNNTENDYYNESNSNKIAAGLMTAAVVILSLMCVAIFLLRRRQEERLNVIGKENLDEPVEVRVSSASKKDMDSSQKGTGSGRKGSNHGKAAGDLVLVNDEKGVFGLADLMKAAAEVLGNGTLGSSYKALMSNGATVVVKRIKEMNKMGKNGFDAEIRRLGGLEHRNILTPLAYHYRKDEKLLVYEYIPKGSLLYLLHGDRGPSHAELNWPARLKIVQGIARGLGYLHTELASFDLPHGDLKSSNVLLGSDHEALLVDYGFNQLVNANQAVQTLFAYRSPEAIQRRQVSPKCDVYCLGIIILEILTGKFPCQYLNNGKGGTDVVQWVKSAISEGREAELFDPEIASSRNSLGGMERLLRIGADCAESNPEERLDIREAIRRIEEIQIQDGRTFELLPSLRDGYADQSSSAVPSHVANVREGFGELSGRRHENSGERSERRFGDSFAFDIS